MQRKGIPMENKTFIDQMGENGYTINDVTFFLDMVKLYEEHYQMSIVDFDINKINSMLNILSPKNSLEINGLKGLLECYFKYLNASMKFNPKDIKIQIPYYLMCEDKIQSEEEILSQIRKLDNPIDKVILACPYYGIGGTGMSELLGIMSYDMDYENNQVAVYKQKIDPNKRVVIDLPKETILWMKEAIECVECNGEMFIQDDHLIKKRVTSKGDDRKKWIDQRMKRINEELGTQYSFALLRRTGLINSFRAAAEQYHINLDAILNSEIGVRIMTQYSYQTRRKAVLLNKYKEYVD